MTETGGEPSRPAPTTAVGWDGSESSRAALTWAVDRERRGGAAGLGGLLLLAVVDDALAGGGAAAMELLAAAAARALRAEVVWLAREAPEVAVDARVVRGDPATALQQHCPPEALIVVGRRFQGASPGRAVAARLAGAARQPVVVVPGSGARAGAEVVVGVDGTPASARASLVAAREADRMGAPLRVVHAWPGDGSVLLTDVTDIRGQRAVHERLLAGAVDVIRADHPALTVLPHLEVGPAVQVVRRQASDAALVVVGSRGQGPVRRFLLGSVSTALLDSFECPLVVVTAPPTG